MYVDDDSAESRSENKWSSWEKKSIIVDRGER